MEQIQCVVKAEADEECSTRVTDAQVRAFLQRLNSNINGKAKQTRKGKLTDQQRKIRAPLRPLVKWVFDVELDRERTPLYWGVGDSEKIDVKAFYKKANEVLMYAAPNPFISTISDKGLLVREIMQLVKHRRKNMRNSKKLKKDGTNNKRLQTIYEKHVTVFAPKDGRMVKLEKPQPMPFNAAPSATPQSKQTTQPKPKQTIDAAPSSTPQSKQKTQTNLTQQIDAAPLATPQSKQTTTQSKSKQTTQPMPKQKKQSKSKQPINAAPSSTPQQSKKTTKAKSRASKLATKMLRLDNSDSDWSDSDSDFDMLEYMQQLIDKAKNKKKVQNKVAVVVPLVDKPAWIGRVASGVTTGGASTGTCANASCGKDCLVPLGEDTGLCADCWQEHKRGLLALSSATGSKKRKAPKTKRKPQKKQKTIETPICPGTPQREREVPLKRTLTPPNPKTNKRKFKVLFDV